jgi:hypothetical protein
MCTDNSLGKLESISNYLKAGRTFVERTGFLM